MKNIKIKETYLLMLIVFGLVSLSLYTTYALFTASTEISEVVDFTANLTTDSNIIEYEMVTIPAGTSKIIEVKVTNSYETPLSYGAWYKMVNPTEITEDIQIGIYKEKDSAEGNGTIAAGDTLTILVGVSNNSASDIKINIGVAASENEELYISEGRTRITQEYKTITIVTPEDIETGKYVEEVETLYEYTGKRIEVTLNPGTYKLELWGAQGGEDNASCIGGNGGYSYGDLTLTEETKIYIYVGGKPNTDTTNNEVVNGGFNGGGNGYNTSKNGSTITGQGGGGASDIRIGNDSLYTRVIVAGGGSGATSENSGYNGGGTTAEEGQEGYGATLTGKGNAIWEDEDLIGAKFGAGGGVGDAMIDNNVYATAGGGGGWYGGDANPYNEETTDLGGGSGWVYTEENFNAWKNANSNDANKYLLDSKYYLTNAQTMSRSEALSAFPYDDFVSSSEGGTGHGKVKITNKKYLIPTIIGLTDLKIMEGSIYDLTQDIYVLCTTGGPECSLIEVSVADTSTLDPGTHEIYYIIKDAKGNKYQYTRNLIISSTLEYTTPEKSQLTLGPGTYLLEAWGAQGGNGYNNVTTYAGGKGGYSSGTLTLDESTVIWVNVGGKGIAGGTTQSIKMGGYNGGGNSGYNYGGSGGGASDIRIITDDVTDENSLYARVIVAGGGGGGAYYSNYVGGSGGGASGIVASGGYSSNSAKAGTVNSGGAAGGYSNYKGVNGSFGSGGNANTDSNTNNRSGGGGGGWYGGGGGGYRNSTSYYNYISGGGGGSGWVYTEANAQYTASSYTGGTWLLDSRYYLDKDNAKTIAGDQSFTDFDGSTVTGHSGDGAVRITKIG